MDIESSINMIRDKIRSKSFDEAYKMWEGIKNMEIDVVNLNNIITSLFRHLDDDRFNNNDEQNVFIMTFLAYIIKKGINDPDITTSHNKFGWSIPNTYWDSISKKLPSYILSKEDLSKIDGYRRAKLHPNSSMMRTFSKFKRGRGGKKGYRGGSRRGGSRRGRKGKHTKKNKTRRNKK